jgi:hypothetical protein
LPYSNCSLQISIPSDMSWGGYWSLLLLLLLLLLCRKPSPFRGHEDAKKNPANDKTAMPETKMGEGNERHTRHDTKDEKNTLVWAFYFNCIRGLTFSRSDSAEPRVRQKTSWGKGSHRWLCLLVLVLVHLVWCRDTTLLVLEFQAFPYRRWISSVVSSPAPRLPASNVIWVPSASHIISHADYPVLFKLCRFICLLKWVHPCNVTAYRNTVSWQCGRDSWPRKVSKVGYAVTLRACSVFCRYLAFASNGW